MTITFPERESGRYEFILLDEDQNPVPAARLSTLTATLYDRRTNAIINTRNAVDVLNNNGGTYHATSGAGTFKLLPSDNVIVSSVVPAPSTETHILLYHATWVDTAGDPGEKFWEVVITVDNFNRVP